MLVLLLFVRHIWSKSIDHSSCSGITLHITSRYRWLLSKPMSKWWNLRGWCHWIQVLLCIGNQCLVISIQTPHLIFSSIFSVIFSLRHIGVSVSDDELNCALVFWTIVNLIQEKLLALRCYFALNCIKTILFKTMHPNFLIIFQSLSEMAIALVFIVN